MTIVKFSKLANCYYTNPQACNEWQWCPNSELLKLIPQQKERPKPNQTVLYYWPTWKIEKVFALQIPEAYLSSIDSDHMGSKICTNRVRKSLTCKKWEKQCYFDTKNCLIAITQILQSNFQLNFWNTNPVTVSHNKCNWMYITLWNMDLQVHG